MAIDLVMTCPACGFFGELPTPDDEAELAQEWVVMDRDWVYDGQLFKEYECLRREFHFELDDALNVRLSIFMFAELAAILAKCVKNP